MIDVPNCIADQSAGAVEYTNCFSQEGWNSSTNECPGYGTKQSDIKAPVFELLGKVVYLFIIIALSSTQARSGTTW